jgi:hypothetical protein
MPPPIKLLFGPMLIGVFLNTILFGVLVVQSLIYYQAYKKDAKWIRYLILYIFIAETVNTACDMYMMFEPLVLKYGTPDAVTFFPMMLAADPIVTVAVSVPVQLFIAWRISIISRGKWIPFVIVVLAIISLGGGLWLGVTVTIIKRFARKPELHWPALMWLLSSAIADVIITASLVWSLAKRKTGFSSTDDAINRIIKLTVQTGMITAIFAILDVICFLVVPTITLNFTWDFALSKLYSNALLSTLNARTKWNSMQTADNVLFARDESASGGVLTTAQSGRRLQFSNPSEMGNTGVYELATASRHSVKSNGIETFSSSPASDPYATPFHPSSKRIDDDGRL